MKNPHCADPFKRHKTYVRKGLRNASKVLAERVNDPRVTKDTALCCNCRVKLTKDPSSLSKLSPEGTQTSTSTVEDSATCSDDQPTSVDQDDGDNVLEVVFEHLKETPVKRSKCLFVDFFFWLSVSTF